MPLNAWSDAIDHGKIRMSTGVDESWGGQQISATRHSVRMEPGEVGGGQGGLELESKMKHNYSDGSEQESLAR